MRIANASGILVEQYDLDVLIDLIRTRQDPALDEETLELAGHRYLSYSRTLEHVYISVSVPARCVGGYGSSIEIS